MTNSGGAGEPVFLDTNVFSEAKKTFCGFDFCPAYWDWIERAHDAGLAYSIERVADELVEGPDPEMIDWLRRQGNGFFLPNDGETDDALEVVESWARREAKWRGSSDEEFRRFVNRADASLVARGLSGAHVVVTLEKSVRDNSTRLKIPNACEALGVECVTLFAMLRREDVAFLLGGRWGEAYGNVVFDGPPLAYGTYGP